MFIHASPNIYLPNSVDVKFNNSSVGTLNYGDKTGYFEASTGTTYQSFNGFTNSIYDYTDYSQFIGLDPITDDSLFREYWCPSKTGLVYDIPQANATLKPGERYAGYITGDRYHSRCILIPAGTVPEEHSGTTQDTCTLRILNLVSDADTSIDVINMGTGSVLLNDKYFLDITSAITTASGSVTLEFWESGDPSPLLSKSFTLQARKIYNVVFKGLKNGSGSQALDAELIEL
jgi:hypothetical protein